ncbi:hypothetical protein PAXINDRAFT_170695, partial [Paxillus involutus ATCC 200175]
TTNAFTNESSSTPFPDHSPQNLLRQPHVHDGVNSDDRSLSLRTAPGVGYPVRIQEGNPASYAGAVPVRGPYTSEDAPSPGESVLRDDLNFVALKPDEIDEKLVCRVSFVYWVLLHGWYWHTTVCGPSCRAARDLWLRMLEGNDDGDEVWLWVDGDEEWFQQNGSTYRGRSFWPRLYEWDWADTQSALRRRIERLQLTPRRVPKQTANLTLEDHARLREATPAQRLSAMCWLILTSKRKEEMDFQLGSSFQSRFALMELINWWIGASVTSKLRSIARFPEQPEAWQEFKEKRRAMGCSCLAVGYVRERASQWLRMMIWLRPEWNLDVECINPDNCDACKSRAEELYDMLYGNGHSRNIPLLPVQLAFSLHAVQSVCGDDLTLDLITVVSFVKAVATKSLSPNAQREADDRFWPLFSPGARNIKYSPRVNAYPKFFREALVNLSCVVGYDSRLPLLPATIFPSKYLDELPGGFADDAPDLMTLVGTVVWILACRFCEDPLHWHHVWTATSFELKETLPLQAGPQLKLRNHLERIWLECRPCF